MIRTCLREAATLLCLLGLYQPLTNKRPSLRSLMYSALSEVSTSLKVLNIEVERKPTVCIVHKLATPQELA